MELWRVDGDELEAREVEQSDRHTLIEEEAGEATELGDKYPLQSGVGTHN
jgi:hypothetical protein